MKVAILGGGFTGLTAAYYLSKNHEVTLFEKEPFLGGLAQGFKKEGWNWYLERTYHHLFSSDSDILGFAEETGFNDIMFRNPETSSLYAVPRHPELDSGSLEDILRIFPLDTPQDLLKFSLLSMPERIRAGMVLGFLKYGPYLSEYERQTAKDFLTKYMGTRGWEMLFEQLFRKKYGKYAEKIVATFIWARITKRTKALGYVKGGFQELLTHLENVNITEKVKICKGHQVLNIFKKGSGFELSYQKADSGAKKEIFDIVISTLPTPVIGFVTADLFPASYLAQLKKLEYLFAANLILETKMPLMDSTYWLSICDPKMPMMVVVQHTNFMQKENYAGNHILYIGNYIEKEDKILKMDVAESIKYFLPHLNRINPAFKIIPDKAYLFKAPFAQPIFDKNFIKNKPDFITPVKNFYIANLDMTYPYDRGTNFAVKLGKQVAGMI